MQIKAALSYLLRLRRGPDRVTILGNKVCSKQTPENCFLDKTQGTVSVYDALKQNKNKG